MRMCFYLQPGKRKSKKMLNLWEKGSQAVGAGCIVDTTLLGLRPTYTPIFYGVHDTTVAVFDKAVGHGRHWAYIDNQYFPTDRRKKNYRVTWDAVQHTGRGESDGKRLQKQLGTQRLGLGKWNVKGRHILITLQSELYFELLMPYSRKEWLKRVIGQLKQHTDRPIIVREKPHPSRPQAQKIPFEHQLINCYALVTLNSATAIEAIMCGIPAFVTDPNCAIVPCANNRLSRIESPKFFDRISWLEVLADNQWSASEIERGIALRQLADRVDKKTLRTDLIQRTYKLEDIK